MCGSTSNRSSTSGSYTAGKSRIFSSHGLPTRPTRPRRRKFSSRTSWPNTTSRHCWRTISRIWPAWCSPTATSPSASAVSGPRRRRSWSGVWRRRRRRPSLSAAAPDRFPWWWTRAPTGRRTSGWWSSSGRNKNNGYAMVYAMAYTMSIAYAQITKLLIFNKCNNLF